MSQPYQLLAGILLAILIAGGSYYAGALSRSGMVAAILLGTVVFGLGGLPWAVLLIAFFISSSLLSRLFSRRKEKMEEKFSKGHRRDAAQVLANGGIAGLCVLLWQLFPGALWPWLAFAGALAAANADTWATELGVLSKSPPRSIRTGRVVEPGDSGGVSRMGLFAATGGSLLIAVLAVLPWPGMPGEPGLETYGLVILLITLAGLGGSLVDSLLGRHCAGDLHLPDLRQGDRAASIASLRLENGLQTRLALDEQRRGQCLLHSEWCYHRFGGRAAPAPLGFQRFRR